MENWEVARTLMSALGSRDMRAVPAHLWTPSKMAILPGMLPASRQKKVTVAHEYAAQGVLSKVPVSALSAELLRLTTTDGLSVAQQALKPLVPTGKRHQLLEMLERVAAESPEKAEAMRAELDRQGIELPETAGV